MSDSDPLAEIERAFGLLNDQFGAHSGSVPIDLVDRGDSFEVRADLPGFDSDDVDVQLVEDRTLEVAAERETDSEHDDGTFITRERHREAVSRRITLPEPVDVEGTSATHEAGVLTVTLQKATATDDDGTAIPVN